MNETIDEIQVGDQVVEVSNFDDWVDVYYRYLLIPSKLARVAERVISEKSYMARVIIQNYSKDIVLARIKGTEDITTLNVWIISWKKLSSKEIDLDIDVPTMSGYEAHEYLVNQFVHKGENKYKHLRKRDTFKVLNIIEKNGKKFVEVDDGNFGMHHVLKSFSLDEVVKI